MSQSAVLGSLCSLFCFFPHSRTETIFVYLFHFFFFHFSDNVHFQQAAQISKALVDAEVDFQAMVWLCCVYFHMNGLVL